MNKDLNPSAENESNPVLKTDGLLEEFARVNTNVDESSFTKRRQEEVESLKQKSDEIQLEIVKEIVDKSEQKRILLEKVSDLLETENDKLGLFKVLIESQEIVLQNVEKMGIESHHNILLKKIHEHKRILAHEFLVSFEELKNQIVYSILDFRKNLEKEKEDINGRTEPYLASEILFDLVIDLLSKLGRILDGDKKLVDCKKKVEKIIKTLQNPEQADVSTEENQIKEEKLEEGFVDLSKVHESKESKDKPKFDVLFEKKIKIDNTETIESLILDCRFDRLTGVIDTKKVESIRKETRVKVIGFGPRLKFEFVIEEMKRNGLRFVNLREFLTFIKQYKGQIVSSVYKSNKKNNKKFDLDFDKEDLLWTRLTTFSDESNPSSHDDKLEFVRRPLTKDSFWREGEQQIVGFEDNFEKSESDNSLETVFGCYAVAEIDIYDFINGKFEVPEELKRIEIEGVVFELGPVVGPYRSISEALAKLKDINSKLKPGEKPWRLPSEKEFKILKKPEENIYDSAIDSDSKRERVDLYRKILKVPVGNSTYYSLTRNMKMCGDYGASGLLFFDHGIKSGISEDPFYIRCIK